MKWVMHSLKCSPHYCEGNTPLKLWKRISGPRPPIICPLFLRCSRDPYPTILGTMRQASTTLIIYTRPPINRSINTMWLIVTTTKNVLTQGCLDNVWTFGGFHFYSLQLLNIQSSLIYVFVFAPDAKLLF